MIVKYISYLLLIDNLWCNMNNELHWQTPNLLYRAQRKSIIADRVGTSFYDLENAYKRF